MPKLTSDLSREHWPPRKQLSPVELTADRVGPWLVGHTVEEIERELILYTLKHYDGNRLHSARVLGISIRGLRNKINQYAALGFVVPESQQSKLKANDRPKFVAVN